MVRNREGKRTGTLQVPAAQFPNNTIITRRNNLHKYCKGSLSLLYPEQNALPVELFFFQNICHLLPHFSQCTIFHLPQNENEATEIFFFKKNQTLIIPSSLHSSTIFNMR